MYPDDFEADTAHLSLAEDGAYNRLLRLQWRSPGCKIPNDQPWIMRKMRAVSEADQALVQTVLDEFFTKKGGKIFSARLLKEWVQACDAHEKRILAGSKGGRAKALKNNKSAPTNAKAMLYQPEPEPEPYSKKEGGGGSARGGEISSNSGDATFRENLLTAIGVDPISGMIGRGGSRIGTQADMIEAHRWITDLGLTEAECLSEVTDLIRSKRDGPPSRFTYFSAAMARLAAAKSAPPPDIPPNTQPRGSRPNERAAFDRSIKAVADGLAAGTIHIDDSSRNPFAVKSG
jgi:uncharacterized protein YdaU (DUF1376 family)